MKRLSICFLVVILCSSHDMYLKLNSYFLEPDSNVVIELFNGTFDRSDNVIDRDRMIDASVVVNGEKMAIDTANWFERETTTYLNFKTRSPGTYVSGVSTKPRSIGMSAEDFNDYLEHDGVLDMLAFREENGTLADTAIERYSKHVKTIFQVGDKLTEAYKTELGYPIEFIPLENPYDLHPGQNLSVKLLFNQQPLANQLVYIGSQTITVEHTHDGHTHTHNDETGHIHDELRQFRTDANGLLEAPITSEGVWYLRTIHLVEINEVGLTHESNWATLTFGVSGGHSDEREHAEGLPDYIYVIISLLLIAVLFWFFNRNK
ncbi:MAG: DUF4198 domain-containing protein [Bacteroidota bacterium]